MQFGPFPAKNPISVNMYDDIINVINLINALQINDDSKAHFRCKQ